MLYVQHSRKEIRQEYISKHNSTCKNQAILLMIIHGGKWHHLSIKNLSALLKGKTSKYNCRKSFIIYADTESLLEKIDIMS